MDGDGVLDVLLTTYAAGPNPYLGGHIHVVNARGEALPGWPMRTGGPIPGSAAVGDLDGDGKADVVVLSWAGLYVWNGGLLRPGFPRRPGGQQAPVVADVDEDADLKIIYATDSEEIWVLDPDGRLLPGWPVRAGDLATSPSVADIDGDGALELVAGTNQGPLDSNPYALLAWEADGSLVAGFPIRMAGQVKVPPAIGALDRDGHPEIVVVSYKSPDEPPPALSEMDSLYVIDARGVASPGWPVGVPYGRLSTPALGDLDRDGDLEIVVGGADVHDLTETLFAFHHDAAGVSGWPAVLVHPGISGNVNSSPVIADIDGDPAMVEVLVKAVDHVFAVHGDGTPVAGFPVFIDDHLHGGTTSPAPAVADVDGDGDVELVLAAAFDEIRFYDGISVHHPDLEDWPMFKQNARNTGAAPGSPRVPITIQDFSAGSDGAAAGR